MDPLRLAEAPRAAELTQSQVAAFTGVSDNSTGRYEKGWAHPSADTLEIMAVISDKPTERSTLTGHFTHEEPRRLPDSTDPRRSAEDYPETVMGACYAAQPDLSPEDELISYPIDTKNPGTQGRWD